MEIQSQTESVIKRNPLLVALLVLISFAVLALLVWMSFRTREVREEKKESELTSEILETKKRLEELERLTPEEKEKRERERQILSGRDFTEDVAVEEVVITVERDRKIVVNRVAGYRIELPLNLVLSRSVSADLLEFHDKDLLCGDPECEPVLRIRTEERNPEGLPLEEWFAVEEKNAGVPLYSPREKVTFENSSAYRVEEVIPAKFEGYYYYWGKGKRIHSLRISQSDEPTYRQYIETFTP